MAKKAPFPPDAPKQCPCAHKHISWSMGETMSFAGTATGDTHYLPVSDHQSKTFLTLRNIMTSLDPDEIKRV